MIILLCAPVNYYYQIPPVAKTAGTGGPARRHWMKSTGGGMSAGTIVPNWSS